MLQRDTRSLWIRNPDDHDEDKDVQRSPNLQAKWQQRQMRRQVVRDSWWDPKVTATFHSVERRSAVRGRCGQPSLEQQPGGGALARDFFWRQMRARENVAADVCEPNAEQLGRQVVVISLMMMMMRRRKVGEAEWWEWRPFTFFLSGCVWS